MLGNIYDTPLLHLKLATSKDKHEPRLFIDSIEKALNHPVV